MKWRESKMKLYELTDSYFELLNLLEQEVDNDHIKEALAVIDDEFDVKAENIVKVIRSLEASAEALKAEKQRFNDRQKSIESNIAKLKDYLFHNMKQMNKNSVQSDLFDIKVRNNAPSLNILDETKIPKQFYIEQQPKLDKRELLRYVKENKVDGVELQQKQSLSIR